MLRSLLVAALYRGTSLPADFHLANNSLLSSFLTSSPAILPATAWTDVRIPVRRLDEMLGEIVEGIPAPRILLKTDTQGYDLRVLRGASGCIDQLIGILAE